MAAMCVSILDHQRNPSASTATTTSICSTSTDTASTDATTPLPVRAAYITTPDSSVGSLRSKPATMEDKGRWRWHVELKDNEEYYKLSSQTTAASTSVDSVATYASTRASDQHMADHKDEWIEVFPSDASPSTDVEFAALFPSSRRLHIRHDDSTSDGNMNLRIDTQFTNSRGEWHRLTLFHLKMNDLRTRIFSLRRHGRESGREMCRTTREQKRSQEMPALGKSPWAKELSSPTTLRRQLLLEFGDGVDFEFSNYFHLRLKRTSKAKYDFDYWGESYRWQVKSTSEFGIEETLLHLIRRRDAHAIAHIATCRLTSDEQQQECRAGGWVPPSKLWLSDSDCSQAITADLADVVVATGLIALVDVSIRKQFAAREKRPSLVRRLSSTLSPQSLSDHRRRIVR